MVGYFSFNFFASINIMPPRTLIKRGFSMIELMLTLVIITILLSLLLVAVQRARATARRTQCMNNLRQLGLALHECHDANLYFPPGSLREWSWQVRLFPYLEQRNLYDGLDLHFEPFETPNRERLGVLLPALFCASDPESDSIYCADFLGGMKFGHTNYHGSRYVKGTQHRGMFDYSEPCRIAEVIDGTSHTIFVGERGIVVDSVKTHGWWAWGPETILSANEEFGPGATEDPSCATHWWSFHAGGAQFVYVDGSTHFLSYSIDPEVFVALGSRDGGESVTDVSVADHRR